MHASAPPAPSSPNPTSTCRSCGAPLLWRTTRRGQLAPCDLAPCFIQPNPTGALRGFDASGALLRGDAVDATSADAKSVHTSHFATCPHAADHRSPEREVASSAAPASPRRCSRCRQPIQLRTLRGRERRVVACDLQTACILPDVDGASPTAVSTIVHGGQILRGRPVKPGTPRAVVGPLLHATTCPLAASTPEPPR